MSIDISIAVAITFLILMVLMITLGNIPRSVVVEVGNYKVGESALYLMKHDGTFNEMTMHLENGKQGRAKGKAVSAMANYNLVMKSQVTLTVYNSSLSPTYAATGKRGAIKEKAYSMSLAFKTNSSANPFGIATMVVGK
ncbi:MAG: hypothetical protein KAW41_01375 [Candidatus Diapherotrites archaeon]|nr:hypothetical protein [Candidatus Diapherotrites archaeon]